MGGLARRAGYINTFRERFKDLPHLLVNTGGFLNGQTLSHGFQSLDVLARNEWVMRSFEAFPVDTVNVSSVDLSYLARLLSKGAPAFDGRFISANIAPESDEGPRFNPYVIRRAGTGSQQLRVAFVGLSDSREVPPVGFSIDDTIEVARRVVPRARKDADLVVVLGHLKAAEAERLAHEVPGIDAIIAGNELVFTMPVQIGRTSVAYTPLETRTLGELRFYRAAAGFTTFARFIPLDGKTEDDAGLKLVDSQNAAIKAALAESEAQWSKIGRVYPGDAKSDYVTPFECASCHRDQYVAWMNSSHGKPPSTKWVEQSKSSPECSQCHYTGPGLLTASGGPVTAGVSCEHCHGPGREHSLSPAKGYGLVVDKKSLCLGCHTPATSPQFNLPVYWEKVRH